MFFLYITKILGEFLSSVLDQKALSGCDAK